MIRDGEKIKTQLPYYKELYYDCVYTHGGSQVSQFNSIYVYWNNNNHSDISCFTVPFWGLILNVINSYY